MRHVERVAATSEIDVANARPPVREYLGWRGTNPVCVSSSCNRRKRLELGPWVHANPFRLESRHRNHLVQFVVSHGVSERIRQTCDQHWSRRARSRGRPANTLANHWRPYPLSLLDSSERHYPVLVMLGFLFFLAFVSATRLNQHAIALRPPLLVGFFLAALIIHGRCQQWWIGLVLGSLCRWSLMIGATILTAFNDNAAVTYLASLVPGISDALKYIVVAGAVTGGGLTVIANSPNLCGARQEQCGRISRLTVW
jgi:Putative Na+/H+ antiporter